MSTQEMLFRGVGITAKKASGPLRFHQSRTNSPTVKKKEAKSEAERLQKAIDDTKKTLEVLRQRARLGVGEAEAEIFEIHAMLLEDEDFNDALTHRLTMGKSAEEAVSLAVHSFSEQLRATNDDYLAARISDLRDIEGQLLDQLSGNVPSISSQQGKDTDESYILVANDLTPSQTVLLDQSKILGFVTFGGTPNSHTAILARAMGIPALVGVGVLPDHLDNTFALLDAGAGTLTVSPSPSQIMEFEQKHREETELAREHERYLRSLINKPAVTRSGHKMLIYANVGGESEVSSAMLNGADGIGLFRSEFLNHYHGPRKAEFDDFEKAFHLYVALDVLNFAVNTGNSHMQQFSEAYLKDLRASFL